MKITFSSLKRDKIDTLALGVGEDKQLSTTGKAVNEELKSLIVRTLDNSRFSGKSGQVHILHTPSGSLHERVVLFGLGKGKALNALEARKAGAALARKLDAEGVEQAAVVAEAPKDSLLGDDELAAELGYGVLLGNYRFDKYFTKQKEEQKAALAKLTVFTQNPSAAKKIFARHEAVHEGVTLTRELVSEPANVIYPESFAARIKELAEFGIDVEVLGEKQMQKLGMGALLGVGQGSARESQLVVMRWNGTDKNIDPVAIVGKGVTFDTGGISIKPANGMEEMKWDMGGSGVTVGLMRALAARKAQVNVVGVVGLVENMPSSTAQRPGDVVTSMSGQTIEVINTDAEGRLVLADALWYTQDRFKPQTIVNLATLTGAIIVGLGKQRAGLFSNNDNLAQQLYEIGEEEGERVWRLPIGDEYAAHIKSDIADMKNVGKAGQAGSISAAEFLSRFVNDVPWAHLDIAGTTWTNEDLDLARKGATGFGVRLLDRWIAKHYEK